jgi:hypothetical protein
VSLVACCLLIAAQLLAVSARCLGQHRRPLVLGLDDGRTRLACAAMLVTGLYGPTKSPALQHTLCHCCLWLSCVNLHSSTAVRVAHHSMQEPSHTLMLLLSQDRYRVHQHTCMACLAPCDTVGQCAGSAGSGTAGGTADNLWRRSVHRPSMINHKRPHETCRQRSKWANLGHGQPSTSSVTNLVVRWHMQQQPFHCSLPGSILVTGGST